MLIVVRVEVARGHVVARRLAGLLANVQDEVDQVVAENPLHEGVAEEAAS